MNEVLHKHSVIRPHNSPTSWEQLFVEVQRDELRLCRDRQGLGCQPDMQWPSGHKVLGAGSAPRMVPFLSRRKEHRNRSLFPTNCFLREQGKWKLKGFCFLSACPLPLPRAHGGPAEAVVPALVLRVVGRGPWHRCRVLWDKDSVIAASGEIHVHFGQRRTRGF